MDKMVVEYEIRTVYGKDVFYARNATGKTICEIAGNATLREKDLRLAKQLGFDLVCVPRAVELRRAA